MKVIGKKGTGKIAAVWLPAIAALAPGVVQAQGPVGSGFTYQGRIKVDGVAPNGRADFEFSLWGHPVSQNAAAWRIGGQALNNIRIEDGLFTVILNAGGQLEGDSGVPAFDDSGRWLEVRVAFSAGSGDFVTLAPRQSITAAPYALKTIGLDGHSLDAADGVPVDALIVDAEGRVGIGTPAPTEMLTVAGAIKANGGIRYPDGTLQLTAPTPPPDSDWDRSGSDLYYRGQPIAPDCCTASGDFLGFCSDQSCRSAACGIEPGCCIAWTSDCTLIATKVCDCSPVSYDGRVGIGTDAPQYTLHVKGDATAGFFGGNLKVENSEDDSATIIKGNLLVASYQGQPAKLFLNGYYAGAPSVVVPTLEISGGSDIAEPFDVAGPGQVKPGTVVSIDPDSPGRLRLTQSAYDRTVAGIISGAGGVNPGMTLHQKNSIADGKHPVALTGRVYAYGDAEAGGPIRPGDLLTTSGTPGHAMKVSDHDKAAGAIIGKAMSTLESGKGLVLVLVNLQ